jgi:hypothetical protein
MSLRILIFLLVVTLLQSCSQRQQANVGLAWSTLDVFAGSYDSALPPIYGYKAAISGNGFDEDDYNEMEQELILFNQNKEHL